MPTFPHPKDVPGLEGVTRMLEAAQRVGPEGPPFHLCICDEAGRILAAATVAGFDRVKKFSRDMTRLGFTPQIANDVREQCDVKYIPLPGARDIFDDGSPLSGPMPL